MLLVVIDLFQYFTIFVNQSYYKYIYSYFRLVLGSDGHVIEGRFNKMKPLYCRENGATKQVLFGLSNHILFLDVSERFVLFLYFINLQMMLFDSNYLGEFSNQFYF